MSPLHHPEVIYPLAPQANAHPRNGQQASNAFLSSRKRSGRRGYVADAADDGAHALDLARRCRYDLVILDLLLPAIDGLTVLRELRRENPELPVLILSARSDLPTKLNGFELGARDYIQKPFAVDELLARVRVQLRPARRDDPGRGPARRAACPRPCPPHGARRQHVRRPDAEGTLPVALPRGAPRRGRQP